MMISLQSRDFLVTVYPAGDGVRTQVSMAREEGAAMGAMEMLDEMAQQLTRARRCLERVKDILREEQEEGGI